MYSKMFVGRKKIKNNLAKKRRAEDPTFDYKDLPTTIQKLYVCV